MQGAKRIFAFFLKIKCKHENHYRTIKGNRTLCKGVL